MGIACGDLGVARRTLRRFSRLKPRLGCLSLKRRQVELPANIGTLPSRRLDLEQR